MTAQRDASSSATRPADRAALERAALERAVLERAVLQLAARQHGVVTRSQLLDLGLSPAAIDRRLATGRLTALHRAVYRVGPPVAPRAREMAAVLACGSGTADASEVTVALSHGSAAALLRIVPERRAHEPVEVSVVGSCRPRDGIRVHRVRSLPADEVTRVEGIPSTTAARTILDLAPLLAARELERATAEAIALRCTTVAGLLAVARSARHARRPGVHLVRALLAGDIDPARTRSAAEERFLELVRQTGLPEPDTNVRIGRYTVDFLWRVQRIVVEIDGFAFHSSPASFEADRRRDSDLDAADFRVLRFTWRKIKEKPMTGVGDVGWA